MPAAEQRAAIWDGPDVLTAARAALDHGTRDERQWAGDVVRDIHHKGLCDIAILGMSA